MCTTKPYPRPELAAHMTVYILGHMTMHMAVQPWKMYDIFALTYALLGERKNIGKTCLAKEIDSAIQNTAIQY